MIGPAVQNPELDPRFAPRKNPNKEKFLDTDEMLENREEFVSNNEYDFSEVNSLKQSMK